MTYYYYYYYYCLSVENSTVMSRISACPCVVVFQELSVSVCIIFKACKIELINLLIYIIYYSIYKFLCKW